MSRPGSAPTLPLRTVRHYPGEAVSHEKKVTRAQFKALQQLSRKDINTIRKNPGIVAAAKDLMRACRKVIKRIEAIPEHASRRKRATAYRRVLHICRKAVDNTGS